MSLNDEFNENKPSIEEKKKKSSKKKIYGVVITLILVVLFIVGGLNIYQALFLETGYFYDYSMAPAINNEIKNKDGEVVEVDNYKPTNGYLVEYGLVKSNFKKEDLKRFDVVVLQDGYNGIYKFSPYRIIGLPGETIKIDFYGKLYVNDSYVEQPIPDEYLELNWNNKFDGYNQNELYFEENLVSDSYYLLKDNRYFFTNDSRTHGGYDIVNIYGVVKAIQGHCTISGSQCINATWPITRLI